MALITHADSLIKIFQLGKSILDFGQQAFMIVRATVRWFTRHHQEYLDALKNLRHYYRERDCMSISLRRHYESTMASRPLLTIFTVRLTKFIRDRMHRLDAIRPQTDFDLYDAYVQAQSLSLPRRQPLLLPSAPESDSDSDTRTNVRFGRRNQPRPRAVTSSATMNSVSDSNNSSQGNMYRQPCNAPSWYQGSNINWANENGYDTDGDGNVM
jgi:hypothetical protein